MYNKILNRPMFKRGGDVIDSQGTGITSGLDAPRQRYDDGDFVKRISEIDVSVPKSTRNRAFWSGIGEGFSNARTLGEALSGAVTGQEKILGPAEAVSRERRFELDKLPLERTMAIDVAKAGIGTTATQTRANILSKAIVKRKTWEAENPGKDFRLSPEYIDYENQIIIATQGKTTTLGEARATALELMLTDENFAKTYKFSITMEEGEQKEIYKKQVKDALDRTVDFLMSVQKKAHGGRIGYNTGVGPNVMEGMASETIKMPGQTMQATEVEAEVLPKSGSMNEVPMNQEDPYKMLRARLPQEVTDDVVRLIAYNPDAFADFAAIESQEDIMLFNQKYGVELVLPTEQA